MSKYQVIGVNDSKDFCECCGKKGLKKVVWILDTESSEEKHFGTTCAASPAKGFGVDKEIKAAVDTFQAKQKEIFTHAYWLYKKRGGKFVDTGNYTFTYADQVLRTKCLQEAEALFN